MADDDAYSVYVGGMQNDNFRTSWTQLWTPREVTVISILVDVASSGGAGPARSDRTAGPVLCAHLLFIAYARN